MENSPKANNGFIIFILLGSLTGIFNSCTKNQKVGVKSDLETLDLKSNKPKQVVYLKVNGARITDATKIKFKLTGKEKNRYAAPLFADIAIVFESAKLIPASSPKLVGEGKNVKGRIALAFKEWYQAKSFSPSAAALDKNLLYNSDGSKNLNPEVKGDAGRYSLVMNKELQADVKGLSKNGLKVLLDIMPDHEDAGWASLKNFGEARQIATQINDAINSYGFDGIDIDEEYADYKETYSGSMVRVLHELTTLWNAEDSKHPGKALIIGKALFQDRKDFTSKIEVEINGASKQRFLSDYLTDGWEMNYQGNPQFRIADYMGFGMKKERLGIGFDFSGGYNNKTEARDYSKYIFDSGYGYLMIYDYRIRDLEYYSVISNQIYKRDIEVVK